MNKKTILITGVAGLLGSRLADWIIKNTKHKVVGIDDLSGGFLENINKYLRIATEKKNEKPPKKVAHRARQFKESAGRIKHAIASRNHQFLRPKLAFSNHTCFE